MSHRAAEIRTVGALDQRCGTERQSKFEAAVRRGLRGLGGRRDVDGMSAEDGDRGHAHPDPGYLSGDQPRSG